MDTPTTIRTHSAAETQTVARQFAATVKNGGVIALIGPLGAGKTTFVQGLASGLGIHARILSPSFLLHRQHGRLHHIDLYRLERSSDLSALGLPEIMKEKGSILVIEWAEKLPDLPKGAMVCRFTIGKGNARRIDIEKIN